MLSIYEEGIIKVVWVTDEKWVFSKMFEDLESAKQFAQDKKDFLIFKLLNQQNMNEFTWEVLEYGRYGLYKKLFNLYKKDDLLQIIK